ncbi:hypothetical protein RUM44_004084 [Polyplax serrata]|uniref:Uncharacterized protein n=1 Tax=Polyplax serrata TaxID=468196 RepID=A0ABR1B3K4_POLSC
MQSCDQKKHFVPDVKKECLQRIRKALLTFFRVPPCPCAQFNSSESQAFPECLLPRLDTRLQILCGEQEEREVTRGNFFQQEYPFLSPHQSGSGGRKITNVPGWRDDNRYHLREVVEERISLGGTDGHIGLHRT